MNKINWSFLVPSLGLVLVSLSLLFSIDMSLFKDQFVSLIISLAAYFIIAQIDFKLLSQNAIMLYILSIVLLSIVFVIGIESRGAVRWINIFGFSIQVSEVLKPFFIVIFAAFITHTKERGLLKLLLMLTLFAPIFFLVLKQPDLGNALIYLFVLGFMLLLAQFPIIYFIGLGVIMLLPMPFLFNMLHEYQKQRIYTFLNYGHDPLGISYNALQSMISVGSGGWFGKGFGHATQSLLQFLPERHTDFIFATLSETFGFLGVTIVLVLFTFLLWKIYQLAAFSHDAFVYLVIMGFYMVILTHAFLNIGMNIGIVPIVGITLPFVSYGGSSLLTNFIILGILTSLGRSFNPSEVREIR